MGCFVIGLVAALVDARQMFGPDIRVFLLIGVLGGFTTFSSFAYETLALARDAEIARAFVNVAAQIVHGLAGATVLRGLEGFGARSRLHTAKILRLSSDLPIVVEIVDTIEKIEAFLPVIDEAVHEGLATLEKVDVRFYRGGSED